MSEKPLFVPLKAEFYEAFLAGAKTDELRRYGPRWNERTCVVGRQVLLSCGYGRSRVRIRGRIDRFKRQHGSTFGSTYRAEIERVYGTLDIWIACIGIQVGSGTVPQQEQAVSPRRSAAPASSVTDSDQSTRED